MANLLGQDIGLNYKGIITIGSTINQNVSASLQSLTDGDGNALPLQLSTSQLLMGTAYTAGYYLNVKAVFSNYASSQDETANIALFGSSQATLNSATRFGYGVYGHGYTNGSARAGGVVGEGKVTATGDTGAAIGVRGYALDTHAGGINIGLYGNAASGATNYALWMESGDIYSTIQQSWLLPNVTRSSGTNTDSLLTWTYTINNTGGTNTVTGLKINATETAVVGTTHNLLDLQVGASSRLRVSNAGNLTVGTSASITARLGVRGDGTNTIGRFEHSDGTAALLVTHTPNGIGLQTSGSWTAYNNSATQLVGIQGGVFYIISTSTRFQIDLGTNQVTLSGRLLGSASTTTRATLNIPSGVAPTTPSNGDIWFDGTNIFMRIGGVTKTFTLV
jgi:hypothetical protein